MDNKYLLNYIKTNKTNSKNNLHNDIENYYRMRKLMKDVMFYNPCLMSYLLGNSTINEKVIKDNLIIQNGGSILYDDLDNNFNTLKDMFNEFKKIDINTLEKKTAKNNKLLKKYGKYLKTNNISENMNIIENNNNILEDYLNNRDNSFFNTININNKIKLIHKMVKNYKNNKNINIKEKLYGGEISNNENLLNRYRENQKKIFS